MTPSNIPSLKDFKKLNKRSVKIAVIGYGLMGAPLGKALMDLGYHVTACVRSEEDERIIREKRIAHEVVRDAAEAIKNANIVFMCTHVGVMEAILENALQKLNAEDLKNLWLVTDVGSTKLPVQKLFEKILSLRHIPFVLAHPIVGHHTKGLQGGLERIKASQASGKKSMYEGGVTVLTFPDKNAKECQIVEKIYCELGSEVVYCPTDFHDRLLAETSHAIHCNSVTSVTCLDDRAKNLIKNARKLPNASSLFNTFDKSIRIARGNSAMWADICCRENQDRVQIVLSFWQKVLEQGTAIIGMAEEHRDLRAKLLGPSTSINSSDFVSKIEKSGLSKDDCQHLILAMHDEPIIAQAAYLKAMATVDVIIHTKDGETGSIMDERVKILSKFCGTGFRSTTMPLTNELSPLSQKNPELLLPFLEKRIEQIEYASNLIQQRNCAAFQKWLEDAQQTALSLSCTITSTT
ncbi:MAG: prephenate dehydrogenase [bacterium]